MQPCSLELTPKGCMSEAVSSTTREAPLPLLQQLITDYTTFGGLGENGPHRLICFHAWFPLGVTVSEGLGGMALL